MLKQKSNHFIVQKLPKAFISQEKNKEQLLVL